MLAGFLYFYLYCLTTQGFSPIPSKARRHNSLTNDLGFMNFRRIIAPTASSQSPGKTQCCGNFWCFLSCIWIPFTASLVRNACNESSAAEFSYLSIPYRYIKIKESGKISYKCGIQQFKILFLGFHGEEMGILYYMKLWHALIGFCSGIMPQEKWR